MNRRKMLALVIAGASSSLLPKSLFASRSESAQLLMTYKGKSIGLKLTPMDGGRVLITLRQIEGEKLGIAVAEPSRDESEVLADLKMNNGKSYSIFKNTSVENADTPFATDIPGLEFSNWQFTGAKTSEKRGGDAGSEGWFGWLGDVVNDIGTAIGAAAALLTGGTGTFKFSWGGKFLSFPDGGFRYVPKGFKLEPGLEEDPTVWY